MKRYCDTCRQYCDEAAMFCPTCGQYTVATEVERIAPEGDVIYPFAHYQMSYKDTFLYVMGKKFMDTDNGKIQDILWEVDEQTQLSARYRLIDKVWTLESYNIAER